MTDSNMSDLLERYQRLTGISSDLASTLDLNELLTRIVNAAADLCHAEGASILLYDQTNQQLYFQAASNMDEPLMQGLIVPVDSSIAGWIVKERKPIIISDTQKDPRHFSNISQSTGVKTTSLLGVPLITKDKVIGVLEAINKLPGNFSEEDQTLLEALGAQAAVAIQNTYLFQQSDLISELIHELRTPLSSLNTAAYLLNRNSISDDHKKRVMGTIIRETSRLSEMASAFLDLARLESGRTQFKIEALDLAKLLNESVEVLQGEADQKEQTLKLSIEDDLPQLKGDYDKLKQVILNLLSNAIKYTPPKGKVFLSAESSEDETVIHVKDTGVGIPPDSVDKIFEKFFRVPGSEQICEGSGLGLSISKRIISAHRGTIDVDSQVGKGTTISVHFSH